MEHPNPKPKRRPQPVPGYRLQPRKCLVCGFEFTAHRPQHVFCSDECWSKDYYRRYDVAAKMRELTARRKAGKE